MKVSKLGYKGFIEGFNWGLYPKAEKFIEKEISNFLRRNKFAKKLKARMEKETSTHFIDWIDHLVVPEERVSVKDIKKLGFDEVKLKCGKGKKVFKHVKTIFPPVILSKDDVTEIALKPEDLDVFRKKFNKKIEGIKFAPYRRMGLKKEGSYLLSAVERRGSNEFIIIKPKDVEEYKKAFGVFKNRKRKFRTDKEGLREVLKLVKKTQKKLSKPRIADAFFRNERIYWEGKNTAGKIQRKRQDKLGLGWGNHDHHTYRSSRENFSALIKIFEECGYKCRERFFAGEKAGWGAQILEHPQCDIVVFADVDITKKEKDKDFAHKGLKNVTKLGTVGLWIGLHGESILQAGMHHLEARFNFKKLIKDMPKHNVKFMKPFSDFPFLKQAFSKGERWKVEKKRLDKLLRDDSITKEQYDKFRKDGAVGSHLENLQRRQGFKGFNQKSITVIIKAVDPRKHKFRGA